MPRDPADPRIFVSYARSDGEAFARDLREKLAGLGFSLWHDRQDMAGGRDWWRQITEAIDAVEHLVLVMTPAALGSDTVRREWRYARQQGRCVVPVMGAKPLDLSGLPRWMASAHFYDLGIAEQWKRLLRQLESPCTTQRVPMMAPPPPVDFVARPDEFAALKAALLDERGEPVAITSALKGAGGYGKTTLAKALCADGDILDAYHDGVLWVTLGERPGDPQGRIEDLIHVLRGRRESFATRDTALARLGELLADRRCLLVIDDVWHRGDAEPFLRVGPSCAQLLTTRDSATLPDEVRDIRVDELSTEQAVELLQTGLPVADPARLRALSTRLGEWPLLLKLANSTLRERVNRLRAPLPDALVHVERLLDRRGLTAFDPGNARSREEAVGITLDLSLDVLSDAERTRLNELAVFPEDLAIPLPAIELLWRQTAGIDELDTEDTLRRLFALSLLLDLDLTDRTARLHDVIRSWLRHRLGGDGLAALDRALVARYRELCAGAWQELPDDGYALQHLPGHLRVADETAWRDMLVDPLWMIRKLEAVGIADLIDDYKSVGTKDLRLIGDGLRLSAHVLSRDPVQLVGQMCGRLGAINEKGCQDVVVAARSSLQRPALITRFASLSAPAGPLVQVVPIGHQPVALTPDGRYVASGGPDGTLRVWDVLLGVERTRFGPHDDWIQSLAISPDGKLVLSGSFIGSLRVWDVESARERHCLQCDMIAIKAIALTPDGKYAISGSDDGSQRIWDVTNGAELNHIEAHRDSITAIAAGPDGQFAVSSSIDGKLCILDLMSGLEARFLGDHRCRIGALTVTPDGKYAASGDEKGSLRIWSLESFTEVRHFNGHEDWVTALAVTSNGQYLLSGGEDRTVRVWDFATGTELLCLEGHSNSVLAVAEAQHGQRAVSGGADGALRVWDLASEIRRRQFKRRRSVRAVSVTPNIEHAVTAGDDGNVRVWDLATGTERYCLEVHSGRILAMALTQNGQNAVLGGDDRAIRVWDLMGGGELLRLEVLADWILAVGVTPDGKQAVSGDTSRRFGVWDLVSGREQRRLDGHGGHVQAVAVAADGRHAISSGADAMVRVWDIIDAVELYCLQGHTGSVHSVAVTSDSQYAVSGGNDGTLRVWDLANRVERSRFEAGEVPVRAVEVTPDGLYAISGSDDGAVRIWDLANGGCIATFTGDWPMTSVAVASDRLFVAGDEGGSLHIVDLIRP